MNPPHGDGPSKNAKPYDKMNGIAANMLLNLTSSVRFAGQLNVDLNEITTNLVPFPRMHYLVASMAPLAATRFIGERADAPRHDGAVLCRRNELVWARLRSDVRQ